MLDRNVAVVSCKQIQQQVFDDHQGGIGSKLIRYVMTKEMNLVFR